MGATRGLHQPWPIIPLRSQNPPSPYGGTPGNVARETEIARQGASNPLSTVPGTPWQRQLAKLRGQVDPGNPFYIPPANPTTPGTTQPTGPQQPGTTQPTPLPPAILPPQQPATPANPMPFLQSGRKQVLGDFIRPVDVDPRYGTRNLPQSFIRRQVDGGPSMSVRQTQPTTPGNPTTPALPPALQPTPSTPTPGTTLPGPWIRPDGSTGTASPNYKISDASKKWIESASDILRRTENTPALSADQRNDMIKSIADLSQDTYDWKTGRYKRQDTFDPTSATRNPLDSALSEDQFFKQNPRGNYQEYRDFYDKELLRKQSEVQDNGFQAWVDAMTRIGYNAPEFRQSLPRLTQENEAAIQGWLNRNPGKTRADYYINSHRPV